MTVNGKSSKIHSDVFRRDMDSRVVAKFGENHKLTSCLSCCPVAF